MEKLSQIRGRPKGCEHRLIEQVGDLSPEGCLRTKLNWAFGVKALNAVGRLSVANQNRIWGHSFDEIHRGRGKLPRGWNCAANEIGRYLSSKGDASAELRAAEIMLDARCRGIHWRSIAAHFRRLRLGDREGSTRGLVGALVRAIDQHRRQFPATQRSDIILVVSRVLDLVSRENGK